MTPDPDPGWHEKKYRDPNSPRVVQVILSTEHRGDGTKEHPHRLVKRVHDVDGYPIAEADPVDVGARRLCRELEQTTQELVSARSQFKQVYDHNTKLTVELRELKNKVRRLRRAKR